MESKKTERQSGIELLRIVAIFFVVWIHYSDRLLPVMDGIGGDIVLMIRSLSSCAVDLFLLIMGYFLCKTDKRTLGKPISLLLQVIFCNVLLYLFFCFVIPHNQFSIKVLCVEFIPASYFPLLYVVLYFISPYINRAISNFGKKEWNVFILTAIGLFSVYPVLVDLSQEILDIEWFGNSVGAWGDQQGFNIVNFALMYCVGAYLRNVELPAKLIGRKQLIAGIVILVSIISLWAFIAPYLSHHGMRSAWVYHNPLVIMLAAAFFLLFRTFDFRSRFINATSKLCFLCFLIHNRIMFELNLEQTATKGLSVVVCHYLCFVIAMFVVAYIANLIYQFIFGRLIKFLDTKQIPYFSA